MFKKKILLLILKQNNIHVVLCILCNMYVTSVRDHEIVGHGRLA